MAGIQATTGLISGVKITDTVDQLVAVSARPRDILQSKNKTLQDQQVAIGQLSALVIGVQLATDGLSKATLFQGTRAQSSSTTISASITGTAKAGKYQFMAVQQAQQQQYTSSLLASSDQLVGAGTLEVHAGGFLDTSISLDELNGGTGVSRGSIKVTDRSGATAEINLRNAFSAADVVKAINSATDIRVTAKLSGDRFVLTDNSGGGGNLSVAEVGSGTTARDLGLSGLSVASNTATGADVVQLNRTTAISSLLDGRGVKFASTGASLAISLKDGSTVNFTTTLKSNSASVGQLLDALNTAGAGKFEASINSAGDGIQLKDLTTGSATFQVSSPSGNLAKALGWDQTAVSDTLSGAKLQSGLGDVLLSSLKGGSGLGTLGDLTLKDRSGATATVSLASAKTIGDVLNSINSAGIGVTARLNDSKTGITLTDTTGASANALEVTNADATNTATKLGLAAGADPTRLNTGSLNRQWINENTLISTWNQGKGLTLSSFTVTNSAGVTSTVNLSSSTKTIAEVIDRINSSSAGVTASINETGDGLLLVDTAGGTGNLTVTDNGSGTSAKELGLAGTSKSLTVGGNTVKGIDGTRDVTITTTATTTVSDLVTLINSSGATVQANLVNQGTTGVRVAITSAATGAAGRLTLEPKSLAFGLSETSTAQNALLSVGGNAGSAGLLLSSNTDTFAGAIEGVSLTINGTSNSAITVEIKKNDDAVIKQIQSVVDQYNKIRDKLKEVTSFDSSTYKTGLLFGSVEVLRTESSLSQLFGSRQSGTASIRSMADLGVTFNDQGKLSFDSTKLTAAMARDPGAVQDFFSKATTGFAARAKAAVDGLTGTRSGLLLKRTESIQATIELNSKRIASMNLKLDRERTRLLTQFYKMEESISSQQSNLSSIQSLSALTSSSSV